MRDGHALVHPPGALPARQPVPLSQHDARVAFMCACAVRWSTCTQLAGDCYLLPSVSGVLLTAAAVFPINVKLIDSPVIRRSAGVK